MDYFVGGMAVGVVVFLFGFIIGWNSKGGFS